MNPKRAFRTLALLLMIGLILFGLTSCQLRASKGPQSSNGTGNEFPIPGGTEPTSGGIDVSQFATQTAQAKPPVVNTPVAPAPTDTSVQPTSIPTDTAEPTLPPATPTPVGSYVIATPGAPPETYTLQEGEYPFCIARRFNVNQGELLTLNNLTADTLVGPGYELKIPQTGDPFDGTRALHDHPTVYSVVEGDNLNSIACYFGDVSPDMIMLQNNMSSAEVTPGTELVIP